MKQPFQPDGLYGNNVIEYQHSRIQVLGPNSTRPRCLAFLNKGTSRLLFLLSMFRPSYLIQQQITQEPWKFFTFSVSSLCGLINYKRIFQAPHDFVDARTPISLQAL